MPQVAVFDTAFHTTIPAEASTYALPRIWREEWGIRRYGFHGLSVQWCAERAPELLERSQAQLRLVVCHLGGGCSVTAVRDGCSIDTTMGFSPLEGVPMTTRSGSVDPGALLYIQRQHAVSVEELDRALNEESGLKGMSGLSGDVRELEAVAQEDEVRGLRSSSTPTGSPVRSPRWPHRREDSTHLSSQPASASTPRGFVRPCAHAWRSWVSSSTLI